MNISETIEELNHKLS